MKQILDSKYIIVAMVTAIMLLFLSSCSDKTIQAKSMEQIYKEEGVPVRIVKIIPRKFRTELKFHSILKGIKESTAFSAIGAKIEKVLVKVGDYVKKNQILVTLPADSPSASYFQAKISFENARIAFRRINGLFKSGGISLQERDNAKAQLDMVEANWVRAKQMIKVKAPINGYVTKVHISETDNVNKETALVTIAHTEKLKAIIWVSEDDILNIKNGLNAIAIWKENQIKGIVTQVDIAMNLKKQAFRTVVEFDNSDNHFIAGTTVDVNIITSEKNSTIVIERKDILRENKKHFVYVAKNGKSIKQEVSLGGQQGFDTEILQGLQVGEKLITEGQMLLNNNRKIKIVKNK